MLHYLKAKRLIPLGLTAPASAKNAAIQNKILKQVWLQLQSQMKQWIILWK